MVRATTLPIAITGMLTSMPKMPSQMRADRNADDDGERMQVEIFSDHQRIDEHRIDGIDDAVRHQQSARRQARSDRAAKKVSQPKRR